ncbi:MAG: potassium channel family protein [Rhodobacterales bacterium]|nr:potassium channel family protein [Rhodobacterales bacterium]MDX5411450.1 potassium channel family protein [Rhodobacterales bacterium]
MILLVIILVGLSLIGITVLVHYEALRITGKLLPGLPIRARQRVLVVIFACLLAHIIEVSIYAATYALLLRFDGFGSIDGLFDGTVTDFLYFSLTSYTTLGIGEVHPVGPIRMIAGLEALNGFLLITWSASFTYLMMQRYWHPEREH